MSEFWKQHFDKVLLSSLFLMTLGAFFWFSRAIEFHGTPENTVHLTGVINWLENTVGQILAALLTLMVGRSLAASATATTGGTVTAVTGSPAAGPAPFAKEALPNA